MQIRSKSSVRYVIWGFLSSLLLTVSVGGINAQPTPPEQPNLCISGAYTLFPIETHTDILLDGSQLTLVNGFADSGRMVLNFFGTGLPAEKVHKALSKNMTAKLTDSTGLEYSLSHLSSADKRCFIPYNEPLALQNDEFWLTIFAYRNLGALDTRANPSDIVDFTFEVPSDFGISTIPKLAPESTTEVHPQPVATLEPAFTIDFSIPITAFVYKEPQSITHEGYTITLNQIMVSPFSTYIHLCIENITTYWQLVNPIARQGDTEIDLVVVPHETGKFGCLHLHTNKTLTGYPIQLDDDIEVQISGLNMGVLQENTPEIREKWINFIEAANQSGFNFTLFDNNDRLHFKNEDHSVYDEAIVTALMIEAGLTKKVDAVWTFTIPTTQSQPQNPN